MKFGSVLLILEQETMKKFTRNGWKTRDKHIYLDLDTGVIMCSYVVYDILRFVPYFPNTKDMFIRDWVEVIDDRN